MDKKKKKINSYLNKNNRLFPAHCSLLKLHRPPSLRKDLLLVSRKSLQCNNVLSSFFCRERLLSRLPASLTDCLWLKMSICPIMCAVSCFPPFLLLPALCLIFFFFCIQGEVLKHTHTCRLSKTGNYSQRMEQVRGVQIALWDSSAGRRDVNWRGCHFSEHLIHCSLRWIAGGSVTVFTCTSQDVGVFVCLCQGEWFAARWGTLAVHKMGTWV